MPDTFVLTVHTRTTRDYTGHVLEGAVCVRLDARGIVAAKSLAREVAATFTRNTHARLLVERLDAAGERIEAWRAYGGNPRWSLVERDGQEPKGRPAPKGGKSRAGFYRMLHFC